ncbi:hypothetical protein [uncultured Deinococcus sp.]|uniref:hypothetical protein n=1 Tax=uncultured Deinococcus sp. TaxID=158789 RepID=UPI00258D7D31|nr:hypothetical protein [uncultured Deinococcus sp.]
MAGLPCEVCQEEAIVVPSGFIVSDNSGNTIYKRYRVCSNPTCDLYLIRRETFEVFAPLSPDAVIFPANIAMLRKQAKLFNLVNRTAPFPIHLVNEETLKNYSSIGQNEIEVLTYARQREFFYISDLAKEMKLSYYQAHNRIQKLVSLGLVGKSSVYRAYAAVPDHLIPDHVYLPPELQRSAS